jgi:hypothetical protein
VGSAGQELGCQGEGTTSTIVTLHAAPHSYPTRSHAQGRTGWHLLRHLCNLCLHHGRSRDSHNCPNCYDTGLA